MAEKDYKGPNRRQKNSRRAQGQKPDFMSGPPNRYPVYRGIHRAEERRSPDSYAGHRMGSGGLGSGSDEIHGRPVSGGSYGVVEEKIHAPRPERRQGPGRRKGDLGRALKSGEAVTFDVSKMGRVSKLARKAGKLGVLLSAGSAIYDMVNKQKQ